MNWIEQHAPHYHKKKKSSFIVMPETLMSENEQFCSFSLLPVCPHCNVETLRMQSGHQSICPRCRFSCMAGVSSPIGWSGLFAIQASHTALITLMSTADIEGVHGRHKTTIELSFLGVLFMHTIITSLVISWEILRIYSIYLQAEFSLGASRNRYTSLGILVGILILLSSNFFWA